MRDHKLHHFRWSFLFLPHAKLTNNHLRSWWCNHQPKNIEEDLLPNFKPDALYKLQESEFFRDYETGKIDSTFFIKQLQQIANNKTASDDEIKKYWNGILKDIPIHRIEILRKLKENYKLILLSNTNEVHLNEIYHYMQYEFGEDILTPNFHHCYYSQEIGLRKPNQEIYEFVLQNENLAPETCLFLDDKLENLIQPQKLGIHTHHINFNQFSKVDIEHLF